ncbi:MAG TPA: riboflavin synthase [Candidatus Magasanikbacteria bacterium]|nr:riboflavin synthase [Candidatus Magasanikbacteria bacterium]
MFTGIIKSIGIIEDIKQENDSLRFFVSCPKIYNEAELGSSVCISGVCLTVAEKINDDLVFELMPETLRKTIFRNKKPGSKINLESSLHVGDELGGHFVYGHVNTVGKVVDIKNEGEDKLVSIEVDDEYKKYLVAEGSVAVDGVSLTIARTNKNIFTVSLIQYTLLETTLGILQIGDEVNIEFDMMLKYLENLVKNKI